MIGSTSLIRLMARRIALPTDMRARSSEVVKLRTRPPSPAPTRAFKGYELGAVDYVLTPTPEVLRAKVAVFVDLFNKAAQVKQYADALGRLVLRHGEVTVYVRPR